MSDTATKPAFVKGLAGVVAAQTAISMVDGPNSTLVYRGYNINELAEKSTYEEVCFLILYGRLPSVMELREFTSQLVRNRVLPPQMYDFLRTLPVNTVPMSALRAAVAELAFYEPDIETIDIAITTRKTIRLISQMSVLLGAYHRIRNGKEPVLPRADLTHAENMLYMLNGEKPNAEFARAMDLYLMLLADHSLNASTFTARVVASTQADLHSAISSAYAALKGPLHGGANEATMNMLLEIADPEKVDTWVDNAFATKRTIMGFGHRIYKNGDPRAAILNVWAQKIGALIGQPKYYEMSRLVEKAVLRHRELHPNVDYYSASMLWGIGIPIDLFTPMFACSRVVGWSAHVIEQYKDAALIRPAADYIGPVGLHYTALGERA
jgi:citrate synthase